jgi:hypothetical protein
MSAFVKSTRYRNTGGDVFKAALVLLFLSFMLGLLVSQGFTDLSYKPSSRA